MVPASTSCAPYQRTPTTLAEMRKIAVPVRNARIVMDRRAASKASSAAAAKRRGGLPLHAEGLHGAHGPDGLGGEGGRVGEPVLRRPRPPPHGAARQDERQDDNRDRHEHEGRQLRARDDHQHDGAQEQKRIAQGDRGGGAERRLHLSGVGREAGDDLAALGLVEEGGVEGGEMPEHGVAQIGHDPLAERDDEVVAERTGHREDADHQDQHREIGVDDLGALPGEAVIDDPPHGERNDERGGGSGHQGERARPRSAPDRPARRARAAARRSGSLSDGWRRVSAMVQRVIAGLSGPRLPCPACFTAPSAI